MTGRGASAHSRSSAKGDVTNIPGSHRDADGLALTLAGVDPGDIQYALHHRRPQTGAIYAVPNSGLLATAAESAPALAYRPPPDWEACGLAAVTGLGADLSR